MKKQKSIKYLALILLMLFALASMSFAQRQAEKLNRGLVAIKSGSGYFVSWRLLGSDPDGVSFNVYRDGTKLTSSPLTSATSYTDASSTSGNYTVRAVVGGTEQAASEAALVLAQNYLSVAVQIPAGGTVYDGSSYTYASNDCSVGDLDGDGQYEIVVKWDPSDAQDNAFAGYTGNVILDAYKLNGTRLWRINLGKNIRAGAHYTQFQVYDLDGDGKAEIVCKTADGTVDGTGKVIGDAAADWIAKSGYVTTTDSTGSRTLSDGTMVADLYGRITGGPEYLTVLSGQTGAALKTIDYLPARGSGSIWGDAYGNRGERYLAGIAYLDGSRPSVVMCRGYYARTSLWALDWRNGNLTQRWLFDSDVGNYSAYECQGAHSLSVADVDADGKDEIVYGACVIDDNGAGLYTTGLQHGDALHVGDFDPDRAGLEVWQAHEGGAGATFRDARTGSTIFKYASSGDVGRGCIDDMTAGSKGCEAWAGSSFYTCKGANAGTVPGSCNFVVWWDGDLLRELLNSNTVAKYGGSTLLTASGCTSNNGTKSTPSLSADLFGDWREEVIFRTSDNSALRIYTTTTATNYRFYTLMHDIQYREAIAWQNTAYNQPPHTGFYLGDQMSTPARPNLSFPGTSATPTTTPTATRTATAGGLKGDVNNSGTIDIVDALMTAQYSVGLNPAGFDTTKADVNCDGAIMIVDALMIAQRYVGLLSAFPC